MGYWLDAALANKLDRGNRRVTFHKRAGTTQAGSASVDWNLEGNVSVDLTGLFNTVCTGCSGGCGSNCQGGCGSSCSTNCHGCSSGCSGP